LLLTGQRWNEVTGMTRRELSDDGAPKNGRAHTVPLSPLVRELIASGVTAAGRSWRTRAMASYTGCKRCMVELISQSIKRRGVLQRVKPRPFALHKAYALTEGMRNDQDVGKQDRLPTGLPHQPERGNGLKTKPDNPFIFTTTGTTPVSGWGRMKDRLDAAML
jgi:hypothetical protein